MFQLLCTLIYLTKYRCSRSIFQDCIYIAFTPTGGGGFPLFTAHTADPSFPLVAYYARPPRAVFAWVVWAAWAPLTLTHMYLGSPGPPGRNPKNVDNASSKQLRVPQLGIITLREMSSSTPTSESQEQVRDTLVILEAEINKLNGKIEKFEGKTDRFSQQYILKLQDELIELRKKENIVRASASATAPPGE